MAKEKKITGVKKAIGEYRDWTSRHSSFEAEIMLDKSTGEVWADCFVDCNSWKEYESDSIVSLSRYIQRMTDKPLTMNLLKEYAAMAMA